MQVHIKTLSGENELMGIWEIRLSFNGKVRPIDTDGSYSNSR